MTSGYALRFPQGLEHFAFSTLSMAKDAQQLSRCDEPFAAAGTGVDPVEKRREVVSRRIEAKAAESTTQAGLARMLAQHDLCSIRSNFGGIEGLIRQSVARKAGAVDAGLVTECRIAQNGFVRGDGPKRSRGHELTERAQARTDNRGGAFA